MDGKKLTINDFEELWYFAREVLYNIRYERELLNEDGDYIGYDANKKYDERAKLENPVTKHLYWDNIDEFKSMEIAEALDLTTEEIRSRYLSDTLPLARAIMRKDSFGVCCPVSEEISDEYLDQLICMSWKSELMIRVVYFNKIKWNEKSDRKKGEA